MELGDHDEKKRRLRNVWNLSGRGGEKEEREREEQRPRGSSKFVTCWDLAKVSSM